MPPLSAWSFMGHRVIARVAEDQLSPAARRELATLLAAELKGRSLDQWFAEESTWADRVRRMPQYKNTERLHYVDVPLGQRSYDPKRDCADVDGRGTCVIDGIERYGKILADRTQPREQRIEALKFVIHMVGDMHQPLHASEGLVDGKPDLGGNKVIVKWFGQEQEPPERVEFAPRPWNLHSIWDRAIVDKAGWTEDEYTAQIGKMAKKLRKQAAKGNTVDWALEAHDEAERVTYGKLPADRNLGDEYVQASLPVVKLQLARASVRLAVTLNRLLS